MGKVSEQLNTAIEDFLDNASAMSEHIASVSNPHAVTKTQVGLTNVTNDKQATEAQLQSHTDNVSNPHSVTKTQVGLSNVTNDKQATDAALTAHTDNVSNPHTVTKTQVGLDNVTNDAQATKAEYTAHTAASNPHNISAAKIGLVNVLNVQQASKTEFDTHVTNITNPHQVTKTQVGLSNVSNVTQASAVEYAAHVAGTADKHDTEDVVYDETRNLRQYISALVLNSGAGTMDHSLLENRDVADSHPASAISGLGAAMGYEMYVFSGSTADGTATEILTEDTGDYINASGQLLVPLFTALQLDISVFAGQIASGRFFIVDLNRYSACMSRTSLTAEGIKVGSISTLSTGGTPLIVDFDIETTALSDGSVKLMLTLESAYVYKAIVKVTPVTVAEFA